MHQDFLRALWISRALWEQEQRRTGFTWVMSGVKYHKESGEEEDFAEKKRSHETKGSL